MHWLHNLVVLLMVAVMVSGMAHQVSIRRIIAPSQHYCSGSIISERLVLTASRCWRGLVADDLVIVANTNYVTEQGQRYRVRKIKFSMDKTTFIERDLSLLVTHNAITLLPNVVETVPIGRTVVHGKQLAVASEWIVLPNLYAGRNQRREIPLKTLSAKRCSRYSAFYERTPATILCAKIKRKADRKYCLGDLGAALLVNDVLVGIETNAPAGCNFGPDGFTRVLPYVEWIDKELKRYKQLS